MKAFAPAKINLSLAIGAKAVDGYHPLESLVVFADCGDALTFVTSDALSLRLDGPFGGALAAEADNLVLRAARALQERTGIKAGARITLHKNLPIAAGLGGGSADAAAALRGLNRLWRCGLDTQALEQLAASLGADVPVCVQSRTRLMRGRGEILENPPAWPVLHAVLVNPGIKLSTGAVFARFDAMGRAGPLHGHTPGAAATPQQALEHLADLPNSLTGAACALVPEIAALLEELASCEPTRLARLCGSGATCMALVASAADGITLARAIARAHPQYWVRAARLGHALPAGA